MPDSEDISLLKRYVDGDESAFTLLVDRYIHLVYSTALRQVGNPSHAEEISQAVFIILTRKAESISPKTILSGWLYQTARLTAANFLRSENNRQQREQEAYMQSTLTAQDIESWNEIAPLLEEAMGRLGQADRDAIVLRFFENKTPHELATIMGLNEVTARKRVNRALERLRNYFSKRGVDSTTSAIAETISGNAVQVAPVGLAKSVTIMALAKGAGASISTLTLIKGALKIMAWSKTQTAIVAGAFVLLAVGTTTIIFKEISNDWINDPRYWKTDSTVLAKNPPAIILRPSRGYYSGVPVLITSGDSTGPDFRVEYKNVPFNVLLGSAYGFDAERIWPGNVPRGKFDYMFTLPGDYQKAYDSLKTEIKKQYGLVAHLETREQGVLLVKVSNPNATGFKMASGGEQAIGNGFNYAPDMSKYAVFTGASIDMLAWWLEETIYKMPVLNETGLTNDYDFTVSWKPLPGQSDESAVRGAMLNQFGLELVPGHRPIKTLVVEKAR